MSGPKSSDWSVLENLRLAALRRQAALADADRAEGELTAMFRAAEAARAAVGGAVEAEIRRPARPGANASLADIEAYERELRRLTTTARARVGAAEALGRLQAVVAEAAAHHQQALEQAAGKERQAEQARQAQRLEDVRRVLSRAPGLIGESDRAALDAAAQDCLQASAGRARGLEMELRAMVQRLQDKAAAQVAGIDRAVALKAELRGLSGGEVKAVLGELAAVERGERDIEPGLSARAEEAARAGRRKADRAYAAEVLRDELEALGYAVDEDFQTAFAGGGEVVVSRPDRSPYGVRIAVDPHADSLDARVVRLEADEASAVERRRRDQEADEVWCGDFAAVLARASRRKVVARVVRRLPPGAEAVPRVEEVPAKRARRRAAEQLRTRPL